MPTDPEREKGARLSPVFLTYQFSCLAYLVILMFTYGTIIVFKPSFKIDNFYVPALNKPLNLNSTVDTTTLIFFNLKFKNEMIHVGLHYEALNLTFSYVANTSSSSSNNMVLATYNIPGFYQGMNKKAGRRDVAIVTTSLPWKEAALGLLAGGSKAEFRVDVATHDKLNNGLWFFLRRRINIKAGGTVKVDDSGKESRESVDLTSGETISKVRVIFWVLGYVILILVGVSLIICGLGYIIDYQRDFATSLGLRPRLS